jgi:hypothetical protein
MTFKPSGVAIAPNLYQLSESLTHGADSRIAPSGIQHGKQLLGVGLRNVARGSPNPDQSRGFWRGPRF